MTLYIFRKRSFAIVRCRVRDARVHPQVEPPESAEFNGRDETPTFVPSSPLPNVPSSSSSVLLLLTSSRRSLFGRRRGPTCATNFFKPHAQMFLSCATVGMTRKLRYKYFPSFFFLNHLV
ncbi:hypothetical protein K0M31_018524 [Melipona bicolor]|uniref:Uncharacterized protein n=1 Tax=Melipona bicolor TaxID=60889 RepID=A0AA40G3K7_9HYME|nr:hypothetical protein K0M31_018524 [Melipona bicolor]